MRKVTCANRARAEIESFVLKKVTLLRERVNDWDQYPFCVPCIAGLDQLALRE